MTGHLNRRAGRRLAAVVVAGTLVGVTGAMSVAHARQPNVPDARIRAERMEIARWAMANGLSGLSPASLSPTVTDEARLAAELKQIAEWATKAGVSGLSPASVQSVNG